MQKNHADKSKLVLQKKSLIEKENFRETQNLQQVDHFSKRFSKKNVQQNPK